MENAGEYAIRIAAYFDDAMTAAEEEAFMQELDSNEALRREFEDELLVRGLLGEAKENLVSGKELLPQPTGARLATMEKPVEDKGVQNKQVPVVPMVRRYRLVAAVAIGLVVTTVLFLLAKKDRSDAVVQTNTKKDTAAKLTKAGPHGDTPDNRMPALVQNKKRDSAFNLFYEPYRSENDPPEVGDLYTAYRKGRYAEVLSATEADIQLMGTGDREDVLAQYLHLYKGLSYLAENKPVPAIEQFNEAMKKSNASFYQAQWYCALAWLRAGEIDKSLMQLKNISGTASPYVNKAKNLISLLR